MAFKDNLNKICKEKGTTLTRLIKELGLSSSKVTAINQGSIPKEELLIALSEALNCSVMDFFATDDRDCIEDLTEDERDILGVFRSLSREDKHKFMVMVYEYEEGDRD